jgi:hypothetical protein
MRPGSYIIIGGLLLALTGALTACGDHQVRSRATATPSPAPTPSPTLKPLPTTPRPTATAVAATACPLPDLQVSQHISARASYTETETSAAGPMVCRIERDSCAYYHLIGNLGPTIIFKKEEEPPYDAEDILMHPAMLLPLTRLDELVQQEWGGLYWLRITDAYDSLLEHNLSQLDDSRKYSLHFEGRSVDLTTWPIDPARYGRLCALAHCAGFDWVHHEGDHCHASIEAESLCLRCN